MSGCSQEAEGRPEQAKEILWQQLWSILDTERPEFAAARQLMTKGRNEEARDLVLTYFRQRPVPPDAVPAPLHPNEHLLALAAKARRGFFIFQEVGDSPLREDGSIDWQHRGPHNDREWAWFLNRHYYFRYLLTAYARTREETYAEAVSHYLLDWYWHNPRPGRFSLSPAWRALEAARRIIDSWVSVYDALRHDPALSDEALLALLVGVGDHGAYLRRHHHFGGNHLITEMLALATLAKVWPEFREAADWMDYSISRATDEMDVQVYPDGMHKELSNHYQWIAASSLQRLYDLLDRSAPGSKTEEFVNRLEKMWDVFARVRRPNGEGPLNNDANIENNAEQILPIADRWDRQDWRFIGTFGREGEQPAGQPSINYAWGGQAYFRDDWTEQSDWVYFDYGPFGSDHQHKDQLHLSLSLAGISILVDSGRYTYRDDAWAHFFRGWESHNVATFDRHEPILPDLVARHPAENMVFLGEDFRLASATIPLRVRGSWGWRGSFSRTVYHERGILVVVDRFVPGAPDTVHWHWRLHPNLYYYYNAALIRRHGSHAAVARLAAGSSVEGGSQRVVRGRFPPEVQGWYSPAYNERYENSVLIRSVPAAGPVVQAWVFAVPGYQVEEPQVAGTGATIRWSQDGGQMRELVLELGSSEGEVVARVAGAAIRKR